MSGFIIVLSTLIGLGAPGFVVVRKWLRRKRRRCIGCGYSASDDFSSCPECGLLASTAIYAAIKPFRLLLIGLIIAVSSYILLVASLHGPRDVVPSTLLIICLGRLPERVPSELDNTHLLSDTLSSILAARVERHGLWQWQRRAVVRRCISGDDTAGVGSTRWRKRYGPLLAALIADKPLSDAERTSLWSSLAPSMIRSRDCIPVGYVWRIHLQHTEWFVGKAPRRIALVSPLKDVPIYIPLGTHDMLVTPSEYWSSSSIDMGTPLNSTPLSTVDVEIVLEEEDASGIYQSRWSRKLVVPLYVAPTLNECIVPCVDEAVLGRFRSSFHIQIERRESSGYKVLDIIQDRLLVTIDDDVALDADVIYALRIDLLCDNATIASTNVLLNLDDSTPKYVLRWKSFTRGFEHISNDAACTTIRITADESLALEALDGGRFWTDVLVYNIVDGIGVLE